MSDFQTEDFKFDNEIQDVTNRRGETQKVTKKSIHLATEDFFVIGGLLIGVLLVLGMLFGLLPANKLTFSAIGISALGTGAAKMMKTRAQKNAKK